jgi:flagellar biosynthesis protein FlhB
MAEDEAGQDRTEEATPRRLERAREEGQVARSRELNTAAVLLAGSAALIMFGDSVSGRIMSIAQASFELPRAVIFDPNSMFHILRWATVEAVLVLAPVFAMLLAAALAAPSVLGGWLFSTKALAPNLQRIDPVAGLQRMFSVNSLVELLKAIAKVLVVAAFAVLFLKIYQGELHGLAQESVRPATGHAMLLLGWGALALSASTLLIAAVDVPYQMFEHAKKMRMTLQQIRDEMKETEGRPEIKNRIRQLQRQMARNRMMSAVPKADVVITNPTHFAVALRYELGKAAAPLLLAKGSDLVAQRIREIAAENNVPIVSSPRLARAIYFSTELEQEIPSGLYLAVAQVLAYVFHLNNHQRGHGKAPVLPDELPIPEELDRAGPQPSVDE